MRLHEPLQQHIHDRCTSAINDAIICIKLHHIDISNQSSEQQNKIIDARLKHHCPTWAEIVELLTQVRDEMNECKIPLKKF